MKITKSDIGLDMECWVDELSPAQLASYERVANEHNAIKAALKQALNSNEGKELFNGDVFQAYSFNGKVLQEIKDAALPDNAKKTYDSSISSPTNKQGKKRSSNLLYLESTDEEDDLPLAKRIALSSNKKFQSSTSNKHPNTRQKSLITISSSGKSSPQSNKVGRPTKTLSVKSERNNVHSNSRPSEINSLGGLVIGNDPPENKESKEENSKEIKLQGKTFPSLVVLAKPSLKVKDMSATRSKLDSKVKLVLMLTPSKFTEWLIQEGLLKAEQRCTYHRQSELKLGVYSDVSQFPYTGGYVWISDCCELRFISVFHGSIFEGAPHPPSCILKLIYHWSCQTNIQNVVSWVKVDNVYIKGVYTWLRAICTLAINQKCKKLGAQDKFVEVGVISLGTTSQDGLQRQVKVEVLGVLDHGEKTIRLRAVEPVSDADRNYKKRFQTILEPLQRWVHKESTICIDLTVDKMTLFSMGFKNIVQAAATDNAAKHTNAAVMDYLRRIVPRMFQNTLSLLSRQMIQQFLDELVWREQFGTYALQAFNNITTHIAEQSRINTHETLTQRLYQVATNPFKDWSIMPANYKETPANTTPKRLKKPINDADYFPGEKSPSKSYKKDKELREQLPLISRRRAATAAVTIEEEKKPSNAKGSQKTNSSSKPTVSSSKLELVKPKRLVTDAKSIKKDDDTMKGLEELYYGVQEGYLKWFENFPSNGKQVLKCPICNMCDTFDSNEKLQTHLLSHIDFEDLLDHQFQCLFCLEKFANESMLTKHNQYIHSTETKNSASSLYHCLICQQCFTSSNYLISHLQKMHIVPELPYFCQACGYRSSTHCDIVRHFYEDHKTHNFLQCPLCLDIFQLNHKDLIKPSNIENFFMHLCSHDKRNKTQFGCPKCVSTFISMGGLKQHIYYHHNTPIKDAENLRPLLKISMMVPLPKVRNNHREPLPYVMEQKLGELSGHMDGSMCAECNAEIINQYHFMGIMKCNKCNYRTYCERAMFEHSSECNGGNDLFEVGMELSLPNEMHCVCGFCTSVGNKMAYHLGKCGQISAYSSVALSNENTIKRNMLDMLGLVRRDGEQSLENEDIEKQAIERESPQDESKPQLEHSGEESIDRVHTGVIDTMPILVPIIEDKGKQIKEIIESPPHTQQPYRESANTSSSLDTQYNTIVYDQSKIHNTSLDMPLIDEFDDSHATSTSQFLGEVHTSGFEDINTTENQHFQIIEEQQQSDQPYQQHP